jgi:hypothetical protein
MLPLPTWLVASSVGAQPSNTFRLQKGATEAPGGFYIHITARSESSLPSRPKEWPPDTIWFKFTIPHRLGGSTAHNCVVHIVDWRGQDLATFFEFLYQTDKAHVEDTFDIIAIPKFAEKMELHIEYTTKAEWGLEVGAGQYELQLRDYLSLVK